MFQAIQIAGAFAILAAFAGAQFRLQRTDAYPYILLNLVGGALLLISAVAEQQWGFIVLEVAWTAVSAWSLSRKLLGAQSFAA